MPETLKLKAHLVVNRGPNTLLSQLNAALKNAHRADIAVAFVSLAGLEKVLPKLRMVANRGRVRLVFGLYQDVTQPTALQRLLKVSKETGGILSVRISRNHCFHTKFYLLTSPRGITALIGSSNLSREGLSGDGELDLSISFSAADGAAKQLAEEFDAIFSDTVPLTKALIERYAARYDLLRKQGKPKGLPALSSILKADAKGEVRLEVPDRPSHWWRETIRCYAQPKTELIIRNETNWDAKGWQWYCAGPHRFERGDTMLLLDFPDSLAYLARVTDKTECSTPDGRYFVAWKPLKRFRRRKMTDRFWAEMKDHGLVKSKLSARNPRRRLGEVLQGAVATAFRKR
jgi:HKD family nuclease